MTARSSLQTSRKSLHTYLGSEPVPSILVPSRITDRTSTAPKEGVARHSPKALRLYWGTHTGLFLQFLMVAFWSLGNVPVCFFR